MSFEGLKKYVARAPQRLYYKNEEDEVYKSLEEEFKLAETTIETVIDGIQKHVKAWMEMLNHSYNMLQMFVNIYDWPSDSEGFDLQTVPEEKLKAVQKYFDIQDILRQELEPRLEKFASTTTDRCRETKTLLKRHRNAMTKRTHKKLDYDRHRASVEKMRAIENKTEKQISNLQSAEIKLAEASEVFKAHEQNIKEQTPVLLGQFGQFLGPLMESLVLEQTDIFNTIQLHIGAYVEQEKLNAESSMRIREQFRENFENVKTTPERNLVTLHDYKAKSKS